MTQANTAKIVVLGLGYVGLPVALMFFRAGFDVRGFDVDAIRVEQIRSGRDSTSQVPSSDLSPLAPFLTSDELVLAEGNIFIIAVPTALDTLKNADFSAVELAARMVGRVLKPGHLVIFSSTVTIGFTENVCIPRLESVSGLSAAGDFDVAFAPERLDPGNARYSVSEIVKIVSGVDDKARQRAASLYKTVIKAGVVESPSIRVAEAARLLENTQRDINIALLNEVSAIFGQIGVDTGDVLAVARTKWNFMPFRPGLVGGHCVSVHPHFLRESALQAGHPAPLLNLARQINDAVPDRIVGECIKRLMVRAVSLPAIITILGLTYKQNIPDIRGSLIPGTMQKLIEHGCQVQISDPLACPDDAKLAHGISLFPENKLEPADAVILAVPHASYVDRNWSLIHSMLRHGQGVVLDVCGVLDRAAAPAGIDLWCP